MPKYQRDKKDYEYGRSERVSWLDEFADQYGNSQKTAVEVARTRQQNSLADTINAIFNQSRTGHRTVEGVVKDYQERTGLNEYLQRVSNEQARTKTASHHEDKIVILEDFSPNVKEAVLSYVKNIISNHHGHCSVPAVQHDVLSTFGHQGVKPSHILNDSFAMVVSDLIADAKSQNPYYDGNSQNLGKGVGGDIDENDTDNSDFLSSITVNL